VHGPILPELKKKKKKKKNKKKNKKKIKLFAKIKED
jgi:hypothetical protein